MIAFVQIDIKLNFAAIGLDRVLLDLRSGQVECAQLHPVTLQFEPDLVLIQVGAVGDGPLHLQVAAVTTAGTDLEGILGREDVVLHAEAEDVCFGV